MTDIKDLKTCPTCAHVAVNFDAMPCAVCVAVTPTHMDGWTPRVSKESLQAAAPAPAGEPTDAIRRFEAAVIRRHECRDPLNERDHRAHEAAEDEYEAALSALTTPAGEPVAWLDLQKEAEAIVKAKPTWKRFIDGTPLANDIACWMADFAQEHAAPPTAARVPLTPAQMHADELLSFAHEYVEAWNDGMAGDTYLMKMLAPILAKIEAAGQEGTTE